MSCPGFGELNIPSSRAFWDDCDEDECPQNPVEKLELKVMDNVHLEDIIGQTKLMLVIEGTSVVEFAESCLLPNSKKVCEIPSKNSSMHYNESEQTAIVIIEEDLTSSGEITDLLLMLGKPSKVITLTIKPKVDYKAENIASVREKITFIRSIDGQISYVEPLETPNFICGVAAGIASWCSNEGSKVQSYVAYTDNISLDVLAVKPVVKLLTDLGIQCSSASYNPKRRDDSHLYL